MIIDNSPRKIPISKAGSGWAVSIGDQKFQIPPHIERMWVYWLYSSNGMSQVSKWIRSLTKVEISPMQIQDIISSFTRDHPITPINSYSYEKVPAYADPKKGLCISIPPYNCVISQYHERQLLDMIIAKPNDSVKDNMDNWFMAFCNDYGLDFSKKCKGCEYRMLTESFLAQHGITLRSIPPEPTKIASTKQPSLFAVKNCLWLIFLVWEMFSVSIFAWGNNCENMLFGGVLLIVGMVGFALPFVILAKFK